MIVVPAHLADELANECTGMEIYEDFVFEQVLHGATIIGLHPPTKEENLQKFQAWRKENGR